nr:PREDICTED: zinc finger protein 675-like [Bemisia tabaci]
MEENPNLENFKSQVDSMLSALAQLNSIDKSVAFSLLKNCITSAQDQPSGSTSSCDISKPAEGEITNQLENPNSGGSLSNESQPVPTNNIQTGSPTTEEIPDPGAEPEKRNDSTPEQNKPENSKFVCENCLRNFSTLKELVVHAESYPKGPVACRTCTKEFYNVFIFNLHSKYDECKRYRRQIKDSLMKKCSYCQKVFYNAQHFDRHLSGHKRNNCPQCSALFTNRKHLESHMLEVHSTKLEKNFFECKFCFKKFSQKRSILKHYKLHHSKQCSVCTFCGKFFDSPHELDSHTLEHESKKWTCEPCKQTFVRHQQYLKHMSEHDKYFCITCNVGFSSRNKIADHVKLGHSIRGEEQIHQCKTCNNVFESKGKLLRHLKSHEEKGQYQCKTCKISFNKASSYKQHLSSSWHTNKKTPTSENPSLSCRVCLKTFPNKNQLLIHSQEIHGILQNISRCPFCNYKSKSKGNMRRHIDQHTQHRKYVCDQCGSSFYTYSCLKEHITCIHSSERNYSCEKCGMSFKLNSSLKRHMATHSEERTQKCHCGQAYKLVSNLKRHQLIAHGRVDSPKNFQRLTKNDYGEYVPVEPRRKVKTLPEMQVDKTFQLENDPIKNEVLLPMPPTDDTDPLSVNVNDCGLMQSVQVIYQNLDFPSTNDAKQSLLFTPSIDMAHLQLVENMLQAASVNDPLKQTQDIFVDPTSQTFQITDPDSFLTGDVTLHPPLEVSQIGNLDLTSHSGHLVPDVPVTHPSENHQTLIGSLSDYIIPHQFPFLNV